MLQASDTPKKWSLAEVKQATPGPEVFQKKIEDVDAKIARLQKKREDLMRETHLKPNARSCLVRLGICSREQWYKAYENRDELRVGEHFAESKCVDVLVDLYLWREIKPTTMDNGFEFLYGVKPEFAFEIYLAGNLRALEALTEHARYQLSYSSHPDVEAAFERFLEILKENPRADASVKGTQLCVASDIFMITWEAAKERNRLSECATQ